MNTRKRAAPPKSRFDQDAASFTLSSAKTYLGRLADRAIRGEPVYIVRGRQRFILQHLPDIEPIPMRPPGYFAGCYTREDIELDNRLARMSVLHPPADLE